MGAINFTTITPSTGQPCTLCRGQEGRECDLCYGLGYICSSCFNQGIGYLTRQPCNCNVAWQRNFYYEGQTYKRQHLVITHETNGVMTSTYMDEVEAAGYVKHAHYSYNHFALLHSEPMDFLLYRRGRLLKAIQARRIGQTHPETNAILGKGMIYISAPETNQPAYVTFIQQAIQANPNGVLVFFGLSTRLWDRMYPYLEIINQNLGRPMLFFCEEAWSVEHRFLNAAVIDEESDPRGVMGEDRMRPKQIFHPVR